MLCSSVQWVLLTGLSSHKRSDSDSLFLICDTTLDGTLHSGQAHLKLFYIQVPNVCIGPYFLTHSEQSGGLAAVSLFSLTHYPRCSLLFLHWSLHYAGPADRVAGSWWQGGEWVKWQYRMGQEDSYPDSLYHSCCMVCSQVACQCTHGLRGSSVMANEQHLAEVVSVPGSYCTPMHHCLKHVVWL